MSSRLGNLGVAEISGLFFVRVPLERFPPLVSNESDRKVEFKTANFQAQIEGAIASLIKE